MKILHLTTVHPRKDTRIYYRECFGLHKEGHEVILLVADGLGDSKADGFQVIDIGKYDSRLKNFRKGYKRIVQKAKQLKPDLIHFHDPELMFVSRKLSTLGYPVVFDIHENVAVQILDKSYIPKILRGTVSTVYRWVEKNIIRNFHLVIAEHSYASVYQNKGKSLTTVLNLPDIEHFKPFIEQNRKGHDLFYIGGISFERGLEVILSALNILHKRGVDFYMHFIGKQIDQPPPELLEPIISKVKFYGRMDSQEGFAISRKCIAGLSVLKPIKNYVESYPTKIFEYMAVAMCVITSDFPLYKEVVEKYDTGYCVDPEDPLVIADRIQHLIENPDIASAKAKNGLRTVTETLNWSQEINALIALYKSILAKAPDPNSLSLNQ